MKKIISNNKGITGVDLTIGIIVLTLYTGVIISLMSRSYQLSKEIQMSANAMSYATIILEKVDEKAYEDIDADFVSKLQSSGEVKMSSDYTIDFSTEELEKDLFKKVKVSVKYNLNGETKSLVINKLKIKEIYKEWKI